MSNNIYDILGKLNSLTPKEEPVAQPTKVYESVEAKGSVLEGVKSVQQTLSEKYAGFKEASEDSSKDVAEERETLKTKKGTIYKGGTYGTDFDAGEEDGEKKKKPKAKDGEKKGRGRPKKEQPAEYSGPKGDIFGRTTGTAPKGKKGTVVKGKANQDTVDEVAPPGAKAERMVKGIKKSLSKDGKLSKKDKSIAYATTWKAHNAGKVEESKVTAAKALMENVNFKRMVDEANMTVDEMLEGINSDIQAYRTTGDMTARLRDFLHLHNHMKKMDEQKSASFAPQHALELNPDLQSQAQGTTTPKKSMMQKGMDLISHPSDDEMLAQLQQDTQAPSTVDEELDELARMAGISEAKLSDFAKLAGIFQEGKDYGDTSYNEPPTYDNSPDECVQDEDVMLKGGDGEVAGKEKAMKNDKPTFKNADNPLSENKSLLKPAAEFNFVKEMGRDLMKAYQDIKTK